MGWTRHSGRVARARRRPDLESLETRQLLSHASASPKPATSPVLNSDGSTNYDQIIGASATRSDFNVDGTGQTIAVIDTGVDYNNPALGGGIGAGDKVVAGVDFTGSPNGVLPTWQHGTGVAGIAAGNGGGYTGVAPGADIVALRVFGDNNQGSFNEIAEALDWVVQNHAEYNITAVNMSISDGGNYTSNLFANAGVGQQITQAIGQLDTLNIPVVIAAGNSFDGKTQGLGFPAVVPGAISVTATDASDQLASTAQRLGSAQGGSSAVTIAAPGVGITGPSGDNGTASEDGTSFATPQVTGSIVLLQEMYEQAYHTLPTVAELDQLLQQGAVTVHDGATGINVGQLDVLNSAKILEQQITSSQSNSGTSGGTTTTTGSGSTTTTTTAPVTAAPPATTTTTTTTTTTPLTQVFVNGVSLGNYSTAQLAAKYPGLFAFLKGPVPTLQIWAPAGSNVDLGPSPASVASSKPTVKYSAEVKAAQTKVHAETVEKTKTVVHKAVVAKAAAPKKSNSISSFFSSLFPFKF